MIDGRRRFRKAYIEVARGNGKSSLIAGIGAYALIADHEYGAQVYCAATKEDQARIVWESAKKMIEISPELSGEVEGFKRSLFCPQLGSKFQPLGRDSKTQDGFSVHCGIVDEYHAHKTDDMLEVLSSGTVKRRQPLIVVITTAGQDVNCPCKKESDFAKKLLGGLFENDEYLAFVATVDDIDKWEDQNEWIKANPNWGISVYPDTFKTEFNKAFLQPSKRALFKTKNLNIWTNEAHKWMPVEKYSACDGEIDWKQFEGRRGFAALDLGVTGDLSARIIAFMGDEEPEPNIYLHSTFWCPQDGIVEKYKKDGVNYQAWADQGFIIPTEGASTRYSVIEDDFLDIAKIFEIAEVSADPAHAHQVLQHLSDNGITAVKHSQGVQALTFGYRSLEDLIFNKRIRHGNNPVLRWMFSNAVAIRQGDDRLKCIKDKSTGRIDGVVCAAMAVGRLLISPQPKSVYESRGVVAI